MCLNASISLRDRLPAYMRISGIPRRGGRVRILPDDLDELALLNPPAFPHRFVCGPENPHEVHLRVHRDGTDAVASDPPPAHHEGYPAWFHGGLATRVPGTGSGVWRPRSRIRCDDRFRWAHH